MYTRISKGVYQRSSQSGKQKVYQTTIHPGPINYVNINYND